MLNYADICGKVGELMNWNGKFDGLAFGGDYNPEQWPESVWSDDYELMREAGVNLVSIAIHSWAQLEPEPGRFEFGWLDRVMDGLHGADVRVDLGTGTATPPPWMARLYPETLPVQEDMTVLWPGARQTYCPSSPVFDELSLRLVEQLAHRYASHPALAMWHVSNEYGCHNARCYCDVSAMAFRRWLEDRYVTLDRLNDAWGTAVWGQRYSAWEEIMPPRVAPTFRNPTQMIDFRRFSNDEFLARFRAEREVLRRVTPDIPITTNFMVIRHFNELDYWTWSEEPDFISNDHYLSGADTNPHRELAFCADLTRGLAGGEPWLLMEHSTSAVNWQPRNIAKEPGEMIRNSMAHIARGSDGALFFQWRQARAGSEKFHSSMVPHAGRESRVFREVVELGGALRKIAEVKGSEIESRVAMIYDWESWWASEAECHPTIDFNYRDISHAYHHALTASGHTVDFIAPGVPVGDYELLVVPGFYMMNEQDAAVIRDFVAAGGTAIITYGTGVADDDDHAWLGGYLGPLRDVAGVSVEEVHPLRQGEQVTLDDGGNADVWTERVNLVTADSVVIFDSGPVAGLPAIARNVSGSGVAWYVAAKLDERSVQKLVDRILDEAGLAAIERPPSGVEMVRRKGEGTSYLFVINHSNSAVELSVSGTDLLTGRTGPVSVAAGGVGVVREEDG